MYSIVVPFSQSFDDIGFTYKIPEKLENIFQKWMIVKVPFWRKSIFWLVVDISKNTSFDENKIKEIEDIFSWDIFLYDYQVELLKWISKYYFSLVHNSLGLFFPKNLEWKIFKEKFKFQEEKLKISNYTYKNSKKLNQNQQNIFDEILKSSENKFLLYWVTWSWKTEIYINLIKYYLDKWKQVLFLVPEIILNNQLSDRIKEVFGEEVVVLNSTVSEAKKTKYWEQIYFSTSKIIIWTRSSVFYPYKNLWLIIMDEEHDNSYISDITPRYNTLEVINKISDLNDTKIVLWSATPKVNDMYDALKWKYKLLNLFEEYK